ncbi:unnamed protein product [Phaedon cochleariae]|uniref:EF-hand domain-containing protein n=1 Tax=Phaedon cochleariae TaxID=80249 RepID=A0A9P0GIE0_PHACE|nr:unnamed protein product [Phaedon cochleariae]
MVVVFKLKRRFFASNRIILILFFSVILCLWIIYITTQKNDANYNCVYQEEIDVVYTWVNGSDPLFLTNLRNYLRGKNESCDISKQRYDDKYELKFSLRSLEIFAPWVNHVYIVTNGQIPSWLNLDYEKMTIITHEDIFRDSFNLPTFSSPAIESNLHRIPGLSKRFIYFNDDMFLGSPLYPEDFYSPGRGFLVYLAHPVPNCSPSCPWMHVSDGQCDRECFVPQCQMDGEDCRESNKNKSTRLPKDSSIEDLESIKEENETKALVLADTIKKVRLNFYNSFMKKISPQPSTIKPDTLKNISDIVRRHNILVMRKERLRRKIRRKNVHRWANRKPSTNIDAYGHSLQHTNRMLNRRFGFRTRHVSAHAPILIDRVIMGDLQRTFAKEIEVTERNRVRKADDVQFSFSYYSFLLAETLNRTVDDIFEDFDTDQSGTWSDREIRTLLTRMYELPLSYEVVDHFEMILLNCSEAGVSPETSTSSYERYMNSRLPMISKNFVARCPSLTEKLLHHFGLKPKYKYQVIDDSESKYVSFKMLNSDINFVAGCLDDIRRNRRRFICLNDNLDATKEEENELVTSLLLDFYLSLFPHPSKFELPDDIRNKFLYVRDLNGWKTYRNNIKMFICCVIILIPCFTFHSFCKRRFCQITNKLCC